MRLSEKHRVWVNNLLRSVEGGKFSNALACSQTLLMLRRSKGKLKTNASNFILINQKTQYMLGLQNSKL